MKYAHILPVTFAGTGETSSPYWCCGFDCARRGELVPGLADYLLSAQSHLVYRSIADVRAECEKLAHHLHIIAKFCRRFCRSRD